MDTGNQKKYKKSPGFYPVRRKLASSDISNPASSKHDCKERASPVSPVNNIETSNRDGVGTAPKNITSRYPKNDAILERRYIFQTIICWYPCSFFAGVNIHKKSSAIVAAKNLFMFQIDHGGIHIFF